MSIVEQVISDHPFFGGMEPRHIANLVAVAEPAEFGAGTTIFVEGAAADACYLIVDGDVSLEINAPGSGGVVIQTLHGGDILGWSWLFPPYRWTFDARALTAVHAVRFDGARLRSAKELDHKFGYEMMRRFAQVLVARMQAARLQLLDLYGTRT